MSESNQEITMQEIKMPDTIQVQPIHYIDAGDFYSIYGITTLIIIILLLWYFVRSHMYVNKCKNSEGLQMETDDVWQMMPESKLEFKPVQLSDPNNPPYKLITGDYGGVGLNFYDIADGIYNPEWNHNNQMYLPNERTNFRDTYTADLCSALDHKIAADYQPTVEPSYDVPGNKDFHVDDTLPNSNFKMQESDYH